jgi:hypothetical protein
MVDIPDLKSVGPCARVGSSPTARTTISIYIIDLYVLILIGKFAGHLLSHLHECAIFASYMENARNW